MNYLPVRLSSEVRPCSSCHSSHEADWTLGLFSGKNQTPGGSVSKALKSQSEEYGFNKKQCASKKQEQNRFIINVIIRSPLKKMKRKPNQQPTAGGQQSKDRHTRTAGLKTCSLELHEKTRGSVERSRWPRRPLRLTSTARDDARSPRAPPTSQRATCPPLHPFVLSPTLIIIIIIIIITNRRIIFYLLNIHTFFQHVFFSSSLLFDRVIMPKGKSHNALL